MDFLSLLGPLLGIGSNVLGAVMGKDDNTQTSGTSTTGATTVSKDKSSTSLTGSTTQNGTENVLTNQTQNNTQNTSSNTTQTGSEVNQQTGQTQRLDAATTSLLTQQVQNLLRSATTGSSLINRRMTEIGSTNFDTNGFVNGIMQAADANLASDFESGLNRAMSQTGGTAGNNSASALLANKLKTQQAATSAGIRADATARAEEIRGQRSAELAGLSAASGDSLSRLLQPLLSASESSTAAGSTTSAASSQTNEFMTALQSLFGSTGTTSSVNTTQQQQQDTTQKNLQNVAQTTQATEDTKNKKQDWEKLFEGLSKGFSASFNAFPVRT